MVKLPKGKSQAKGDLLDLETVPSLTKSIGEKTITSISLILCRYRIVKLLHKHALSSGVVSDPEKT